MKIRLLIGVIASTLILSCSNRPDDLVETLPSGTTLYTASFVSNAHPTNGTASIIQDSLGNKHLILQNFGTDNGPDLKVYFSTNTSNSDIISYGDLKANGGSFSYPINNTENYMNYNHVLIWCEDFSVLFGHAVLN